MLSQLTIRNFAIIDSCEMELQPGMTALTGETGAGKSILLDALGLVLGDRSDAKAVKHDASKAEITAVFTPPDKSPVWQWLEEHDYDDEGSCILRRIVPKTGKTRGYINGCPVSMQTLRTAGEMLIDIHGQHEHQSLTKRSTQRQLLDSTAKSPAAADKVRKLYRRLEEVREQLDAINTQSEQNDQRIDMLRFQIQEFDALSLNTDKESDELASIENEHSRMANAGRLLEIGNATLQLLDDSDHSAYQSLNQALKRLTELGELDSHSNECSELVNTALINCSEAASSLRDYLSGIDVDAQKLAWLDERLATLHRLGKKHRVEIGELGEVSARLRAELEKIDASGFDAEKLKEEYEGLLEVYHDSAKKLSRQRKSSALTMNREVSHAMNELGMEGGVFECRVDIDESRISPFGHDEVRYLVNPNPGQKPGEISKIASGGELSRISLAVQLFTTSYESVNAFIFDEVDSGIGGGVAETVGKYLRELAGNAQVLCVTHLPQVASQAHNHFLVKKKVVKGETTTSLNELEGDDTIEEIARMLGGKKITNKSRLHAKEMLQEAG